MGRSILQNSADDFEVQQTRIHILAPKPSSSVALGKLLDLSVGQFFHLYKGDSTPCFLTG